MSKNQDVIDAYVREQLSLDKVAEQFGLTRWMVTKMLVEAGIEIRSTSEAGLIAHARGFVRRPRPKNILDPKNLSALIELNDGLQLGDGSITEIGEISLSQSAPRKRWVYETKRDLLALGVTSRVKSRQPDPSIINGRIIKASKRWDLCTRAYDQIFVQRHRWYPKGIKIVPRDLILNPKRVGLWFSGDGSTWSNGGLVFCTHGFSSDDIDYLRDRLHIDLGVDTNRIKHNDQGQFVIHIGKRNEAVKLRDLIIEHVSPCCRYKFHGVRARIHSNVDWSKVDLGKRRDQEIADELGVMHTTVSSARRVRGIPAWRDSNKKSKTEDGTP